MEEKESNGTASLGGGIELTGFREIEGAKMIVLKKIIGNYVKQIQAKKSDYEKLAITLEGKGDSLTIKMELTAGGSKIEANDTQNNIFVALNGAFSRIAEKI